VTFLAPNGDVFETLCGLIEVTSLHRPDLAWRFVDAEGHEHRWFLNGRPATDYRPDATYETPSLRRVFDHWDYDEDGERFARYRHDCRICRQTIEPGYRADDTTQYIAGLRTWRINDRPVTHDEFKRRFTEQTGVRL
jgi:hypothetical protein